jgi:hypothetical protein
VPKLKIGSDGKAVASIELRNHPDDSATWETPDQDLVLSSGKRLSVHCTWNDSGVSFSAAHEEAPAIGLTAEGPFLIRYTFPDDDSYTVALIGERPSRVEK